MGSIDHIEQNSQNGLLNIGSMLGTVDGRRSVHTSALLDQGATVEPLLPKRADERGQ